jgi:hypothetical protein
LLACGILSSLLYIGVDVLAARQWEGYSYTAQAFSELTAIEAPTRSLMVVANAIPYSLLVLAFAAGVWASAGRERALRLTAGLLVAYTIAGVMGGIVFPMHSRGTQATMPLTDTMHIAFTTAGLLCMLLFIGSGAAAFGTRFRLYSIGAIVLLVLGGAYSYWAAFSRMAVDLPTPGMGVMERINIYATMLWVAVLAGALLRGRTGWPHAGTGWTHRSSGRSVSASSRHARSCTWIRRRPSTPAVTTTGPDPDGLAHRHVSGAGCSGSGDRPADRAWRPRR